MILLIKYNCVVRSKYPVPDKKKLYKLKRGNRNHDLYKSFENPLLDKPISRGSADSSYFNDDFYK